MVQLFCQPERATVLRMTGRYHGVDYRCLAVLGGLRCQLLAGHEGDHARVPRGDVTCHRWDDAGRDWVDPGDAFGSKAKDRLRWNALGYD